MFLRPRMRFLRKPQRPHQPFHYFSWKKQSNSSSTRLSSYCIHSMSKLGYFGALQYNVPQTSASSELID